jgi:hypothetical protein
VWIKVINGLPMDDDIVYCITSVENERFHTSLQN